MVRKVLDAAVSELSRAGYEALRYEQVAERAGVARTTVYRRWPTKADLVRAAIEGMPGAEAEPPETGTLRGDLTEIAHRVAHFSATARGRAILRLFALDSGGELAELLDGIRRRREQALDHILEQALSRGEIACGADARGILDLVPAAVFYRTTVLREPVDGAYLDALVDDLVRVIEAPRPRRRTGGRGTSK